jgi:5'-3' exonuclease
MKIHLINEPVVLFDASCLLYIHGANPSYKRTLRDHIEGTLENLKTTRYIGFIDGKNNFRFNVATIAPYKGNRDKTDILEKFPFFYEVKKELLETYGFHIVHGIEADDIVGILNRRLNPNKHAFIYNEQGELEKHEQSNFVSVIASIDKDLLQLPAMHYNLTSHETVLSNDTVSYIKLNERRNKIIGVGYKFFYAQILMGDVTDNIKGLEKCGPVCAYNVIKDCKTEVDCIDAAKEAFFKKEESLAHKDLLRRRDEALAKGINKKMTMPSEEVLWERALEKYNEMRELVYILRRNNTLGELPIDTYGRNLVQ